ncbi:Pectate lyase, partial [Globisporangium splendens]
MVRSIVNVAAVLAATIATASAAPMPTGTWPASTGTVKYSAPHVVKAGTTFDGAMKTYERSNVQCTDQAEGGSAGAVFLVEPGATLKNVIIGKAQTEGVHCDQGGCTIQNVCVTKVIGGGARYAEDKVIQHNGYGSVSIDGFYVQDFGKLFRACGNCKTKIQRKVSVANVYAVNPKVGIVTVNKNYGDEAKLSNIKIKTSKATSKVEVCAWSQAVTSGEPKKLGHGPSPPLCQYSTSAVTFIK